MSKEIEMIRKKAKELTEALDKMLPTEPTDKEPDLDDEDRSPAEDSEKSPKLSLVIAKLKGKRDNGKR